MTEEVMIQGKNHRDIKGEKHARVERLKRAYFMTVTLATLALYGQLSLVIGARFSRREAPARRPKEVIYSNQGRAAEKKSFGTYNFSRRYPKT